MDKALNYIALARKAGRIELGEEPVGAAARAQHARLIVVAQDASSHTWRRAQSFVGRSEQQCLHLPFTKDQLGQVVGRQELAIAAFTDPAMALAFVKALNQPEKYAEILANLDRRTRRIQQRRREEKSHEDNMRRRSKRGSAKKEH